MARYRKLDLRTWNDKKFRLLTPLPPSGQSLWLYLVLGPHTTNIPGLFEASEISMADRLGWPLKAFREAFREASAKAMAKADWKARLVWLPNAPEYNRPESPNVVVSWGAAFDELPECQIKWEAYQSLKAFTEGLGEAFSKAFGKAIPKPMPNQEQEQEQDQEQEQEQKQDQQGRGAGEPRSTRIPDDFELTDIRRAYAESKGVDPESTFEAFCAYWRSKPKHADKLSWDLTWQSWVLKDAKDAKQRNGSARKTKFAQLTERLDRAS